MQEENIKELARPIHRVLHEEGSGGGIGDEVRGLRKRFEMRFVN